MLVVIISMDDVCSELMIGLIFLFMIRQPTRTRQIRASAAADVYKRQVLTKRQIADYFDITEKTLRAIEARQPEVSTAYKKGRANQINTMGANLVTLATQGKVAANMFYHETQGGGKEEQREAQ